MHPLRHPRNVLAIGIVFFAVAAVFLVFPEMLGYRIDFAGVTMLGALGIAMALMAYVLVAGSPGTDGEAPQTRMDSLVQSIVDLTAQFIIPDWGALIALLPIFLLVLVAGWFAFVIRRWMGAGPARRGPGRATPVTPPEIHMPGPSSAPILVAVGAASLFGGLVIGGTAALVGVSILVLTLLAWGREAMRDYDQIDPATSLPAVAHAGPPPGVHIPGPSFRPLLASIGVAALFAGLVFAGEPQPENDQRPPALLIASLIVLVWSLLGWLRDARLEFVETERADATGHLENIAPPRWPGFTVKAWAFLLVAGTLYQFGIVPPRPAIVAADGAGASAEPSAAPGDGITVTALEIAFDTKAISVAAGAPFTIHFVNKDPASVPHDIDVRLADGTVVANQDTILGGQDATYTYEPLDAGEYIFICSIHPIPGMTGTLTVK